VLILAVRLLFKRTVRSKFCALIPHFICVLINKRTKEEEY